MTPFGARLRALRAARGVTLKHLAEALQVSAAYLSALENVQDCLGDLNDIAVHRTLTVDIATDSASNRQAKDRSRRAFAAGVLTGHEDARLDSILAAAVAACETFAKAKPFWK